MLVEEGPLRHEADAPFRPAASRRLAEDEGIALRGEDQPQEELQCGRLPAAVGAYDGEDLTPLDLQVEG